MDTNAETKESIKNTGKDLKDISSPDPSTNGNPKTNGKKGVSFQESNVSSKEHIQDDVAIEVDNSKEISLRRDSAQGNPSTYRSSDEDDDAFTVLFLIFAWILILLTFPISIFSCFKMVQVKCKLLLRHVIDYNMLISSLICYVIELLLQL